MGESLLQTYQRIRAVHRQIDKGTRAIQLSSGVRCRDGCGACCLSSQVETSPIEMLGIVRRLQKAGRLDAALELVEESRGSLPCIFYQPKGPGTFLGSCSVYEERPSICRLFGFSGRSDKYGKVEVSFCKIHREDFELAIGRWAKRLQSQARLQKLVPLFSLFRLKIQSVCPSYGLHQLMPINEAFLKAAEYLYFHSNRPRPTTTQPKQKAR